MEEDCENCPIKNDCLYKEMREKTGEDNPKKLAKKIGKAMRKGTEENFQKMKKDPYWIKVAGLKETD